MTRRRPAATLAGVPWPATAEQGLRWATGAALVVAAVLAWLEGGFDASRWGPAGAVAVCAAVAAHALVRGGGSRATRLVTAAGIALVAWSAASVAWADTPGRALDATGRTVLYVAVLGLALRPRWPAASVRRLLVVLVAGASAVAAAVLLRAVTAADPSSLVVDGRLVAPLGYANATAGFLLLAVPPALHLAAGGVRAPAARAAALAAAGLLAQVALLAQSRAALLAGAGAAALLLLLSPRRGGILLALGALLAVLIATAPALLDVRGAADADALAVRVGRAAAHATAGTLALVVASGAWTAAVAALPGRARRRLTAPRTGTAATAAALVLVLAVGTATVGHPVAWARDRVDDAVHGGYGDVPATGSRLTGALGSNRGDMYRVAWDVFRAHPVGGTGAEDFGPAYLRARRSDEAPRYAHSFPLGVLAGLGAVGALLWAAALGVPAALAHRRRRRMRPDTVAGMAAAAAGVAVWGLQALVDWTWAFPAVTLPALVLLAAAARATDDAGAAGRPETTVPFVDRVPGGPPRVRRPATAAGRVAAVGAGLAAVVVAAALGTLALSAALTERGTARAATDPAAAARDLDRAARLDPFDADAPLRRGIVLRRAGDAGAWRRDVRRAVDRAPQDWFAHLELGLAALAEGRRGAATTALRRARSLNPRQPVVGVVLRAAERGERVDPDAVEAALAAAFAPKLRPTSG